MPTTYTVRTGDLHDGTLLSVGYATANGERAVRRFLVETDDTAGTKKGAIDAVHSTLSSAIVHDEVTDLPLQNAICTRIGPKKFIVDRIYGWSGESHWGGSSAADVCDFALGETEPVLCYTVGTPESDGLPSATVSGGTKWFRIGSASDWSDPPTPYIFRKKVIRVRIPFRSNANPVTSTIFGLINKVNNASVTLLTNLASEIVFSSETLRFDGARITGRTNASYTFIGYYEFTASPSFKTMSVEFSSGAWTATKTLNLATGDFSSFPWS